MNSAPKLIEHNVKNYLYNTLQSCHNNKIKIYVFFFNIIILAVFVIMTAITLYYCYNNKKSPEEIQQKMIKDQEYILSKIRFYQTQNLENSTTTNITNLPTFNSF
jgi:hypothetical protein